MGNELFFTGREFVQHYFYCGILKHQLLAGKQLAASTLVALQYFAASVVS